MRRTEKEELVGVLADIFKSAQVGFLADYRGLTVEDVTDLRRRLHESATGMRVLKNRIAKLAIKDTPFEALSGELTEPRALIYGNDPAAPAKVISKYEGENKNFQVLKGVLVTKGGRRYSTDADNRTNVSDSSAAFIREGLDESLQRLQTDYIDLYLIHWPDPTRGFDEPMEVFHEARRAGKILYGGVSNFSAEQMGAALDTFPIATDQVGYSLFDRRAEAEILPFMAGNRMGAMSYGPMAHGLLTGTFTLETEFADDDWRRSRQAFGLPLYEGEHFARNLLVVERLKEIAAGYGKTVAQLSLAWVLSNPAVTVALAGAKKPSEIEEDVGGDWELPGDAKQAIEDAFAAE